MKQVWCALSLVLILSGCQSAPIVGKPTALDNVTFMNLWGMYRHCQASVDLDTMRGDAQRLSQATSQQSAITLDLPLPKLLAQQITPQAPRLAADPKAMAAACTIYTGQAALQAGRPDVAADMFRTVIQNHPQPEYAFYVDQARAGMDSVNRGLQHAEQNPFAPRSLLHVSAPTRSGHASSIPGSAD